MMRGTTPLHTFTIPFDTSAIKKLRIIYAQNNQIVFVKTLEDCTLEGNTIVIKLTQENTLALDCKKAVELQIRILTNTDDVLSSAIRSVSVARCLDDEVI